MLKLNNNYMSKYIFIDEVREYFDILKLDKSKHTLISYSSSIDRFFDYLDIQNFTEIAWIDTSKCRQFQAYLKNDCGLQPSSINANIRPLKAFFNWLVENEKISSNPFNKVKNLREGSKEKAYMTEDEIVQFLNACKNIEEKTIFVFYLQLGIRKSELINLKFDDIDNDIILIHGKGSKDRTLALPLDAYELYQQYLEYRHKKSNNESIPYLFISKFRNKYTGQSISLKFKTIMKRAGFPDKRIEELHVHSLRHTFLANFLSNGNDIRMGQAILGHAQLSTTANIYSHIRNSAVQDTMRHQKRLVEV